MFFAGLLGLSFAGGTLASLGSDAATVSRACFTLPMFLFALEARQLTSLDPAQLLGLFLLMTEALSGLVRYIMVPSLLMVEKTANMLGISINTVRTHMRSIYNKLAIHSRQELIDLLDRQE